VLRFKLLVAVLKLFDRTGQLTQRPFHPVEAHGKITRIGLRRSTALRGLTRLCLFAAIEKIIEKVAAALVLRQRGVGQKQNGNCGKHRNSR